MLRVIFYNFLVIYNLFLKRAVQRHQEATKYKTNATADKRANDVADERTNDVENERTIDVADERTSGLFGQRPKDDQNAIQPHVNG